MDARANWIAWGTAGTAMLAWVLANGLDVLSVLLVIQSGGRFAFALHHPAEYFVVYVGVRVLLTLAVCLSAVLVSRRWSPASRVVWMVLTTCALATAAAAWWRLYR